LASEGIRTGVIRVEACFESQVWADSLRHLLLNPWGPFPWCGAEPTGTVPLAPRISIARHWSAASGRAILRWIPPISSWNVFPLDRSLSQGALAFVTLTPFCQQWRGDWLRPFAAGVAGWRFPPRRRCL
jgi:hypothetical protein